MNLSIGTMLAGTVFGSIGFVAFIYGKKQALLKPMIVGAILCVFPYFIENMYAQIAVGSALTAFLFIGN